jgi:hypothetical protein
MQFWLDEGDPIEQLLDHFLLVLFVLLRYHAQFGVGFFVYSGLYTLRVSCVLPTMRVSLKPLCPIDKIVRTDASYALNSCSF